MSLVACPDCGKQISDTAPTCLACGRPMVGLSYLSQPPTGITLVTQPPPRNTTPMLAIVAFVGGLLVLGGALVWRLSGAPGAAPHAAAGGAAQAGPVGTAVHLGDVGVLHSLEGLPTVMLFDSRDDFEAAARAGAPKDDAAYRQLVRSRATFVPAGTRAREVEAVFQGGIRVQLIDGPRPGFVAWTSTGCLQPAAGGLAQ
jgi:hypothetical protein